MLTVTWLVAPVWDVAETSPVSAALLQNSGDFRHALGRARCRFLCPAPSTGSHEPRALPAVAVSAGAVRSPTPAAGQGSGSISKNVCLKGSVRTLCLNMEPCAELPYTASTATATARPVGGGSTAVPSPAPAVPWNVKESSAPHTSENLPRVQQSGPKRPLFSQRQIRIATWAEPPPSTVTSFSPALLSPRHLEPGHGRRGGGEHVQPASWRVQASVAVAARCPQEPRGGSRPHPVWGSLCSPPASGTSKATSASPTRSASAILSSRQASHLHFKV